jgi:anti-anti-sigma regulatory factor
MQQAAPLQVHGEVRGGASTVLVCGQVDWATLGDFQHDLRLLLQTHASDVVVDLAGLDSWTVTAQALFIVAVHRARQRGTVVAVVHLRDRAWLQLERSGLAAELYKTLWSTPRPRLIVTPSSGWSAR